MGLKSQRGILYIKKRSFQEWLVLIFVFTPFCLAFLTEMLGLPGFIRYIMDVILVGFLFIFITKRYIVIKSDIKPILALVSLFLVYAIVAYAFNYQSVFYLIWGIRNTFRFYLAFFIIALFLSEDEANNILKILDVLFWINFVAVVFQFVFLNVRQDNLGGIFGITSHKNGFTLIFFIVVIGKSLIDMFDGREKLLLCAAKCITSLLVAAMAEMKFFFVLFIILLIITSLITRFTKKKLLFVVLSIFAVWVGSIILTQIFSEFEGFLSLERLWESATKENYASNNDINRLSAVFVLSKNLALSIPRQLFGMGLGNCDTSDVAIFNSAFYQNYSYLHYNWFTSAITFLEIGIIGVLIYLSFFGVCLFSAIKKLKQNQVNQTFCRLAIVVSLLSVILFVYNESLKVESGYLVYFVLALPFLASKKNNNELTGG